MKKTIIFLFVTSLCFFCVCSTEVSCEKQLNIFQDRILPNNILSNCFSEALSNHTGIGFTLITGNPSDFDKEVVSDYVNISAYLINQALRTNDSKYIKKNRSKINQLDQSLRSFPTYRGIVFRGSKFPPTANLQKNIIFNDLGFVSTSLDLSIAEHYAGTGGYLTIILSKSGKILSYDETTEELSGEKEILFPRNRIFKVFEIQIDQKKDITHVFLIEL